MYVSSIFVDSGHLNLVEVIRRNVVGPIDEVPADTAFAVGNGLRADITEHGVVEREVQGEQCAQIKRGFLVIEPVEKCGVDWLRVGGDIEEQGDNTNARHADSMCPELFLY